LIKANSALIAEADNLKVLGVTLPVLTAISDTAKRVGAANRMTESQAIDMLTTDILTKYEPLAGFEQTSSKIRKEIVEEESKLEELRIEHAQYGRAIDALKTILSHRGTASDILAIKHAIERDGLTLLALNGEISLYGSLGNARRELERQIKDLEAKRVALDSAVSLLENTASGLKDFLASADITIKKQVQSMIDTTHEASQIISQTAAQANRDISDARGAVIEDIVAIGNKANEIAKQYARTQGVLVFEPLIRVVNGEKIDAKQVRDAVLFAMSILIPLLPLHSDHRYRLEGAMKNLKEDITFGLFS
jgi:exonuclease VII small subunit